LDLPKTFRLAMASVVALAVGNAACAQDAAPTTPETNDTPDASASNDAPTVAPIPEGGELPDIPNIPFEAGTPTSPDCDVNGRWLVAQRVLADAIGQTQASHNWFYYEMRQDGDTVTVTKGLNCGFEVVAISELAANVDSQEAWPALLAHDSDQGRMGTMTASGSGCQLSLEKRYTVRGATQSFYDDPNQPMPTTTQQAMGTTPGWEDWDGDGHPGITLTVSGAATGKLYCAQRDWNQWTGPVAKDATSFQLPATWDSGQDVLGYQGSSLITSSSVPDPDASQHFVVFAKMTEAQGSGDDATICATMRSLLPTLAPAAAH
jgi:hypothetical protein